jgi:hypothetical protein
MSVLRLLEKWPELEVLRDRLLATDPDARSLGRERLTLLLYSARTALPIPAGRLLPLPAAAAVTGLEIDDFLQLMADHGVAPARRTSRTSYFRAGDVYRVLEKDR